MDLIVEAPVNALSFGNVTYNFLRQFWRKNINVLWYPLGGNADFGVFDKIDPEFKNWLETSVRKANSSIDKDMPTFKMWHINGSQTRISSKQTLYSFYELDEPTPTEINLVKLQDKCIFSSKYAEQKFLNAGCKNVTSIPIGFDEDLSKTNKKYLGDDIVHFGLMGKYEKRKHTKKIVQLWAKKFGNNPKFQLSLCITNQFIKPEDMNKLIWDMFEGKKYNNINILPFLKSNSEVNEYLNAIDVDLSGLSGAEGWNLPAFNSSCLGKWSIVLNATSHKDWANDKNSILVEPNGKEPVYDQMFFQKGVEYNQGNIYTWDSDEVSDAMDKSVTLKGQNNTLGEKLKEDFSYSSSVDRILKAIV
mgnify:FL=1|jgi:hypothetical protein|tara:strand:+ start:4967 stop:6049 length:1083 start_codon:yes stop_codon:yes gene_type:complete